MRSQRIGHGFESHYLHHLKAQYAQHIVLFCLSAFAYIVVELVGNRRYRIANNRAFALRFSDTRRTRRYRYPQARRASDRQTVFGRLPTRLIMLFQILLISPICAVYLLQFFANVLEYLSLNLYLNRFLNIHINSIHNVWTLSQIVALLI